VGGQIGVLGHAPRVEDRQQHCALEHELLAIAAERQSSQEPLDRIEDLQRLSVVAVAFTGKTL
jgi:hypothetical protein